jgi:hypothetical protein
MSTYITHYILPVLAVMAVLLGFARFYKDDATFKASCLVAIGFLLGWVSAFTSLYVFHLYK